MFKARVLSNEQIAPHNLLMRLYYPELANRAMPGQFVEVRVPHCPDVFWRRPFSIHNVDSEQGTFDLLFNIVGQGTRILGRAKKNDELDCLGPLGNHFEVPQDLREAMIVAGGLGIAPFAFLVQTLPRDTEITIFYGAANIESLYRIKTAPEVKWNVSTDDGSAGAKGVVTDLLESELQNSQDGRMIYACGPSGMLRRTAQLAAEYAVPAQVSVETVMGCGFGACMGCVVRLKHPQNGKEYALACKDGPVFNIQDIEMPND
ncbi:MAG: dihydroorotate dehydrogenase electron transfer subunit [candidate division KSB1 bacterium]|nr:dihydroorotate dehydrogenase electron transfer subunit [candidate division KSB1 bacterium]